LILADVNVLICAFREDAPRHVPCKAWLDGVARGDARFGVSPLALSAVARITTNLRAFVQPSRLEEAFGFCDDPLSQPHCEIIEPGERHWSIFKRLCGEAQIRGPRISDAWFAALAIERGCVWITYDRDCARFPGLHWRAPST
jgi:toxin-antitoxin system PIN domain toxin